MSFASRLIHSLALVTPTDSETLDVDGDVEAGEPTVTPIRGLIQPKDAREIADSRSEGAELSDHVIFALLEPLPTDGAWISDDPDDVDAGNHYAIVGVRPRRYGRSPHLTIDARLVTSRELASTAGS